jgi:hypothetical protein
MAANVCDSANSDLIFVAIGCACAVSSDIK